MNTQTQEALKMAIEMLEKLSYEYGRLLDGDQDYGLLPSEINADIIKTYYVKRTCQEALEQPAQEPVAWLQEYENQDGDIKHTVTDECIGINDIPVYTHPAQEPVAFRNKTTGEFCTGGFEAKHLNQWKPLYTHPAPSWQGLSDAEILDRAAQIMVERHYKDKNK